MLRPACSPPVARLAPPHGLLIPRSGVRVSLPRMGPATRRSDAYRDGTHTRWSRAASSSRTCPRRSRRFRCVTTHHGWMVTPPGKAAQLHLGFRARSASRAGNRRAKGWRSPALLPASPSLPLQGSRPTRRVPSSRRRLLRHRSRLARSRFCPSGGRLCRWQHPPWRCASRGSRVAPA